MERKIQSSSIIHAIQSLAARLRRGALCLAGATLLMGAAHVRADTVIAFDSLEQSGTDNTYFTSSYSEAGFTFTSDYIGSGAAFASAQQSNLLGWYAGSASLYNNGVSNNTIMTADDGRSFALMSIDLDSLYLDAGSPAQVTFQGTKQDSTVVTRTVVLNALRGFQTFSFTGFTDLTSLAIGPQSYSYHQFDNIRLNPSLQPNLSAVPLPAAAWGGMALMGLVIGKRARRNLIERA